MIKKARGLVSAALASAVIAISPVPAGALDDAEKEELGTFHP